MTEAKVLALESLQLEKIHELIRSSGPCITLLLPAYRPGEHSKPVAAMIKTNLQEAARQLAQRGIPESVMKDLLEPLEQLATDPDLLEGSHWGRAIFRSLDCWVYRYRGPRDSFVVCGLGG